ncbi:unnamed protein product [Protopolystoma xenopodis]|uniref:Uncharacterized protein n=1 Tax=Protopolystoma xenopodis TaxID=117903 RepID=A0A3S5CH20_9PLAT|nr:unnamed protein product [Protopolystoma xenopodis]
MQRKTDLSSNILPMNSRTIESQIQPTVGENNSHQQKTREAAADCFDAISDQKGNNPLLDQTINSDIDSLPRITRAHRLCFSPGPVSEDTEYSLTENIFLDINKFTQVCEARSPAKRIYQSNISKPHQSDTQPTNDLQDYSMPSTIDEEAPHLKHNYNIKNNTIDSFYGLDVTTNSKYPSINESCFIMQGLEIGKDDSLPEESKEELPFPYTQKVIHDIESTKQLAFSYFSDFSVSSCSDQREKHDLFTTTDFLSLADFKEFL